MSIKSQDPWGGKQNKILREGEPDPKPKGSLKRLKTCKKTKGNHEFEWKPMSWYSAVPAKPRPNEMREKVCRLCGKKEGHATYCVPCNEPMIKSTPKVGPNTYRWVLTCPRCGAKD